MYSYPPSDPMHLNVVKMLLLSVIKVKALCEEVSRADLVSFCLSLQEWALGWMGPTMPPSKKAQSPSSGASASQGMSPPYRQGDAATAASEAEAADLSLSLSASFSKAEDEELTSLSWLHESTDLLNSFSHSGLRSVSPLQDPDGQNPRSPSSSSPSPDDPLLSDAHSAYDLVAGANRKPPYSFSCLIFMAIEDAPNKRLPVKDIYGWILEHFPYFASAPTGWKNSVRHNLSLNKCFKKVDKDRSQVKNFKNCFYGKVD